VDIYLDVIFMENLVMNFIILKLTSKLARIPASYPRILLGAFVGALYVAVMILFPDIKFYYSFIAKFLLSLLIIALTFDFKKIGIFAKTLAMFYLCTFIFAGASFAFLYLNNTGGFIRNGVVYVLWESKWTTLLLAVLTTGIILRVIWDIIQVKLAKEKLLRNIKISFGARQIAVQALIDTGNSLHDPISNMPVVIVEYLAIKEILPAEIQKIFSERNTGDLTKLSSLLSGSSWYSRFRLIPFTSLGKENGMLIGFKPDFLEIQDNGECKEVRDVIVGIYNRALSRNDSYRALLSPELA
jgi:stage II sporulation protein GA (sporulation sigma-E factor processing peptidase)